MWHIKKFQDRKISKIRNNKKIVCIKLTFKLQKITDLNFDKITLMISHVFCFSYNYHLQLIRNIKVF